MSNPLGLTKNFIAKGKIEPYALVCFSAKEHEAKSATGVDDKVVGASGHRGAGDGERIDVHPAQPRAGPGGTLFNENCPQGEEI